MKPKKARQWILVTLLAGGLLWGGLQLIPRLVNKNELRLSIEKGLRESLGVKFRIRELTLEPTVFRGLQVHLNTNTLSDDHDRLLGNIDNISIEIRYWPLLTERLPEIAKIHLNHVYIPISELNLFKSLKIKRVIPPETGFLKPAELRDTQLLLTDYLIEDLKLDPTVKILLPKAGQFRIRGPQFAIHHLESMRPVTIIGEGNLFFTAGPSISEAGKPKSALWNGQYNLQVELPRETFQEGHVIGAQDLGKLFLQLRGEDLDLALRYQHLKQAKAKGTINSKGVNLSRGQAVALQMLDTFGINPPAIANQYFLFGRASLQDSFELNLNKPLQPFTALQGYSHLNNLAVRKGSLAKPTLFNGLSGNIQFQGQRVKTDDLMFQVAQTPLRLNGFYDLKTQQIQARLRGQRLPVDSLIPLLANAGVDPALLKGRSATGLLDVDLFLAGTTSMPVYQGVVQLQDATASDAALGLHVSKTSGNVRFQGKGLQSPSLAYAGTLTVGQGQILRPQNDFAVQSFHGNVKFKGMVPPPGQPIPLPEYQGKIVVQDAKVRVPQSDLWVERIRGVLALDPQVIRIQAVRALLGGQEFQANGTVASNLKTYQVRVTGNQINIPQFQQAVLSKIPQTQLLASSIKPYSGTANLDVTVSTGERLQGTLGIKALAMKTPQANYPFKAPSLLITFNEQQAVLSPTTLYYGSVALRLAGKASLKGMYDVQFNTQGVPLDFLRDHEPLISLVSGTTLPEIWNTAGTASLDGRVTNQSKTLQVGFQDAGLSWQGGDFPVYAMNGGLLLQQAGQGQPQITTQDFQFRYGNSPIALTSQSQSGLHLVTDGVLSALAVNHFLVSSQSNATPYQEVPFQLTANGSLENITEPAQARTPLQLALHMDLNPNFKASYQGVAKMPRTPAPEPADNAEDTTAALPPGGSQTQSGRRNANRVNLNPIRVVGETVGLVQKTVKTAVKTGVSTLAAPVKQLERLMTSESQQSIAEQPSSTERNAPIQMEALIADEDNAFLDASLRLQHGDLYLDQGVLHLFDSGNLLAGGLVKNVFQPEQQPFQLHFYTEPALALNTLSRNARDNAFFKGANGSLSTDLQWTGLIGVSGSQQMQGWLAAEKLAIPYLTLQDVTGRIHVNGQAATIDIPSFAIPGVNVNGTARTENIFDSPVTLEDVSIQGSQLSIASLADFSNDIVKPILIDQIVHNYFRPWQLGDPVFPIQFRQGDLQVAEVIYQNIILANLKSQFSVYANSLFELTNASLEAAGGTAHGYLSMNPNDNSFTTLELNVENVKANALTRALLNVTNQIFGDISGTVRFTTFGQTDDELQKNANGTVSMRVTNGRLPAIAKVETLLTTANVIRGGVLGLNLNNLFRSLWFYESNYFAELSGDMLINNQVLYTRNLISDGENLDLLIRGSLRMDSGDANMTVNGQMSQNVSGRFGALGKLSLDTLIRYIPALGRFGKNQPGLLGLLPGIGYIPGFGGPAGSLNRFQVRLIGPLDDPSSIKDFHWVRARNL